MKNLLLTLLEYKKSSRQDSKLETLGTPLCFTSYILEMQLNTNVQLGLSSQ